MNINISSHLHIISLIFYIYSTYIVHEEFNPTYTKPWHRSKDCCRYEPKESLFTNQYSTTIENDFLWYSHSNLASSIIPNYMSKVFSIVILIQRPTEPIKGFMSVMFATNGEFSLLREKWIPLMLTSSLWKEKPGRTILPS